MWEKANYSSSSESWASQTLAMIPTEDAGRNYDIRQQRKIELVTPFESPVLERSANRVHLAHGRVLYLVGTCSFWTGFAAPSLERVIDLLGQGVDVHFRKHFANAARGTPVMAPVNPQGIASDDLLFAASRRCVIDKPRRRLDRPLG